jgi:hypothetical protein
VFAHGVVKRSRSNDGLAADAEGDVGVRVVDRVASFRGDTGDGKPGRAEERDGEIVSKCRANEGGKGSQIDFFLKAVSLSVGL